jgi:hypothetical protein
MPQVYAFHGEHRPGLATTNYLAVVGPQTVWPDAGTRSEKDLTDGPSSTILVVENRGAGIHWTEPRDLSFAKMSLELNRPNGISSKYADPAVVMADGRVIRLEQNLRPDVLKALLTVSGGEPVRQGDAQWTLLPQGRQGDLP